MRTSIFVAILRSDFPHFPLLHGAEQFHLHGERHLPDFIQEQRAAVGALKQTFLRSVGARKRAAHVAEEFRFKQGFWNGGAIQGDKGTFAPPAIGMGDTSKHFLAGASFSEQQTSWHLNPPLG